MLVRSVVRVHTQASSSIVGERSTVGGCDFVTLLWKLGHTTKPLELSIFPVRSRFRTLARSSLCWRWPWIGSYQKLLLFVCVVGGGL